MGQVECLEVIEKANGWIPTTEIIKQLNQSGTSIRMSLKRLYNSGDVLCRPIKPTLEFEWRKNNASPR